MTLRHKITTKTGSTYTVVEHGDGRFGLVAANVASLTSKPLDPQREWPIQDPYPWPPEPGRGMILMPHESVYFDREHPDRMPGGGKVTSPVVEVHVTQEP